MRSSFPLIQLLGRVEEPLLLIDRECSVVFQNQAAEQLLRANVGISVRHGRLSFTAPEYHEWLRQSLARLSSKSALTGSACTGTRIRTDRTRRDFIVVVTAFETDSRNVADCFAVHLISRLYPRHLPRDLLRDVFDLSRREIQVLALLMRGQKLRQVAGSLSVSHETIRSNLKQIFRKCHVASQIELIALMQRISLVTGRSRIREPTDQSRLRSAQVQ